MLNAVVGRSWRYWKLNWNLPRWTICTSQASTPEVKRSAKFDSGSGIFEPSEIRLMINDACKVAILLDERKSVIIRFG